jgi:hypothetical protein
VASLPRGRRISPPPLLALRLALAYVPYQRLLCSAAVRATWRHLRRVNTWEKTAHVGAHRAALYAAQIVGGASRQNTSVSWADPTDLAAQEWGWLATALYAGAVPDVWHGR